jgi:hypothetical protein
MSRLSRLSLFAALPSLLLLPLLILPCLPWGANPTITIGHYEFSAYRWNGGGNMGVVGPANFAGITLAFDGAYWDRSIGCHELSFGPFQIMACWGRRETGEERSALITAEPPKPPK